MMTANVTNSGLLFKNHIKFAYIIINNKLFSCSENKCSSC